MGKYFNKFNVSGFSTRRTSGSRMFNADVFVKIPPGHKPDVEKFTPFQKWIVQAITYAVENELLPDYVWSLTDPYLHQQFNAGVTAIDTVLSLIEARN